MLRRFTKKRMLAALSVVAVLVGAGAAVAYFTSSGSGTGQASVGSSTAFTVNVAAATGGPLYPGSGTENLTYTVHNGSSGHQNLSSTSAAVAADNNGAITDNGTSVTGCKASWFTATNHAPSLPQNLAGGADATGGNVDVTMQDSGTSQNACQGAHPDITVSAG
jgi:hypothetical protein